MKILEEKLVKLQGEIGESTILVEDFIITLSELEHQTGRKPVENTIKLNSTVAWRELHL